MKNSWVCLGELSTTARIAMSNAIVVVKLDEPLSPLGFTRKRAVWNRRSGYVVEAIDVRVSKTGDVVTVNVGVLDIEAHAKLWGG